MLPTIAWRGRSVVMIDQRKLPGQETYVRCRTYIQVAQAIEKMVIRGAPAIGIAAAYGLVLGAMALSAETGRSIDRDFERIYEPARADAADGPEPLLGPGADEGGLRAEPGARPAGHPDRPPRGGQGDRARGRRDEPGHRPARPGAPPRRHDRPDPLQRRGARPRPITARRSASSGPPSRRARRSASTPTRPGPSCRAPG